MNFGSPKLNIWSGSVVLKSLVSSARALTIPEASSILPEKMASKMVTTISGANATGIVSAQGILSFPQVCISTILTAVP